MSISDFLSTYGALGDEFVRLLYILARRQAEIILIHHRPDEAYIKILGTCFAAIKSKVGAAAARAMAMRALSCNTCARIARHVGKANSAHRLAQDGIRRIRQPSLNEFPQYLQQDLHTRVNIYVLAAGA